MSVDTEYIPAYTRERERERKRERERGEETERVRAQYCISWRALSVHDAIKMRMSVVVSPDFVLFSLRRTRNRRKTDVMPIWLPLITRTA